MSKLEWGYTVEPQPPDLHPDCGHLHTSVETAKPCLKRLRRQVTDREVRIVPAVREESGVLGTRRTASSMALREQLVKGMPPT